MMDELRSHLGKISIPHAANEIYKDECVYSYDTPESPSGLYVSLTTFLGFGEEFAERYAQKTGNAVFLHMRREKKLKEGADAMEDSTGPECKITRLAIGLEGGYNDKNMDKYEYKDTYSVVVMPKKDCKIPFPNDELPEIVVKSIQAILQFDSANCKSEKQALAGTWNGETREPSMFSDKLVQLENGKKIQPFGWKCEKCDLNSNLWLNLTDGSILCGRKFFDGSGGNNHALQHYNQTKYPLAVKLGTISADGGDVFSYPENDMVLDTKLKEHLAHFGINMAAMKKSEKSMIELELEINQRIGEWSLLTESETELQPLSGPGYTGMHNLGNSCYINSVMQVLFVVPDFMERWVAENAQKYFNEFPLDPINDFNIQMAKLGNGLWSGKYSCPPNSLDGIETMTTGITPTMFKNMIGKNHPDFSTKQQQDAFDFYLHMINMLERHSRNQFNPSDAFLFRVEERVECMVSKMVRYTRRDENALPLQIPLDKAINLDEVKAYLERKASSADKKDPSGDIVRYKVPLSACLEKFFDTEIVDGFFSSAINSTTTAKKSIRLATMPDYLMVHLRKFTLGDDWVPKKLDVSIDMPDELDLSKWRAAGLQAGEQLLPEPEPPKSQEFIFAPEILSELIMMGFPEDSCKRAMYMVRDSAGNVLEAATNWLMEHIGDASTHEPFVMPTEENVGDGNKPAPYIPDPESLAMLVSMGFEARRAIKALKAVNGNLERAADWIFSHDMELDMDEIVEASASEGRAAQQQLQQATSGKTYRDGVGKYKLMAFISHMGTSAQVGHYVCHILQDNRWVIYNDEKVAASKKPPKDLGYLYLYERQQ